MESECSQIASIDRIHVELHEERQRVWQLVPKLRVLQLTDVLNHSPSLSLSKIRIPDSINPTAPTRLSEGLCSRESP